MSIAPSSKPSFRLRDISQFFRHVGEVTHHVFNHVAIREGQLLESEMPIHTVRPTEMLRFDKLIRPSMTVRDVKQQYPGSSAIFEQFGFRSICDDCSIEVVAKRQGLSTLEIVDALNSGVATKGGFQE